MPAYGAAPATPSLSGRWPPLRLAIAPRFTAAVAAAACVDDADSFPRLAAPAASRRHRVWPRYAAAGLSAAAVGARRRRAVVQRGAAKGQSGGWAVGRQRLALLGEVAVVAAPNIGALMLVLLNEQTNAIFLGRACGAPALAAVGLGNMMQNCFALSIGWGILGAMDTLVSQAHGAGQSDIAVASLQRGRAIATLQLLWIWPLLLNTETLLTAIGQDAAVAKMAGAYNRATAPALLLQFQFQAQAKFLQSQCITMPPLYINLCCSALHVGWCVLLVVRCHLGNAGAGLANAATWTTQWLLLSFYMAARAPRMGLRRRAMLWVQAEAWRGWGEYLKVALPSTLQLTSEWWFWELCALVVGYLGTVQLAAHVAALQVVYLCAVPAIGIASAAAALVGGALGADDPDRAKRLAASCVILNLLVWLAVASLILCFRSSIASIYVRDEAVAVLMRTLLTIFAFAGLFDTTQNVLGGIFRGMGRTMFTSAVYIVAYYGLMLPVGCMLAFHGGFGVRGLWWAFGLGTSIAASVFGAALLRTRFGPLAKHISERVSGP